MSKPISEMNEAELREVEALRPENTQELKEYIDVLLSMKHDYGTAVYAMSLAATAAFYLVAHQLGVSGFQASIADLDVLRRTRDLPGPVLVSNGANLLYPQYDLRAVFEGFLKDCEQWLVKEARKNLEEYAKGGLTVHPNVLAHWKKLAAMKVSGEGA